MRTQCASPSGASWGTNVTSIYLTSGVVYNGSDVDAEFGIYGDGFGSPDAVIENNIVKNVGEFGIWLVSDGANKPYRLKCRAPGFPHLASLEEMVTGHLLADVVAVIGTQDIVFGEIDR